MMLTIKDIVALTGMTRPQVDQMISRESFVPSSAGVENGTRRLFNRADGIRYCVLAAMRSFGVSWDAIKKIDLDTGFVFHVIGQRAGDYPHEEYFAKVDRVLLVIFGGGVGPYRIREKIDGVVQKELRGEICDRDLLNSFLDDPDFNPGALIIDFSRILKAVDDAIGMKAADCDE